MVRLEDRRVDWGKISTLDSAVLLEIPDVSVYSRLLEGGFGGVALKGFQVLMVLLDRSNEVVMFGSSEFNL